VRLWSKVSEECEADVRFDGSLSLSLSLSKVPDPSQKSMVDRTVAIATRLEFRQMALHGNDDCFLMAVVMRSAGLIGKSVNDKLKTSE
jgi:hypothetical protein